ncbi:serine--tRNA ligase [Bacteroidota bacterium]
MLTLKFIKENKELIVDRLTIRGLDSREILSKIIDLDNSRKTYQTDLDNALGELNSLSKKIGLLYKEGKTEEANKTKTRTTDLKEISRELKEHYNNIEAELNDLLVQIPNIPHISVPKGKSSDDNEEIRSGGKIPEKNFKLLPHWDLIKQYDLIDFELGNKLTGAGFPVYKSKAAKLQRALINFFLENAEKEGYDEVLPPIIVNEDSGFGTGQLPDKEGQMYQIASSNLYLIPTAEVPVLNIYRNEILNYSDLPVKNCAYTPCFRKEAGSWGKDVRGLNRLHQFDKVEIIQIEHPDKSYDTLENMVNYVESLVKKLELPYRIMKLCGGDLGFTSAITYDFEVYAAGQQKWLEVSSVSNCEAYQSNRLKLRFKEKGDKKTKLAHTLNGSALALPRIVAALLENNQEKDGIKIPKVLTKYTGFSTIN